MSILALRGKGAGRADQRRRVLAHEPRHPRRVRRGRGSVRRAAPLEHLRARARAAAHDAREQRRRIAVRLRPDRVRARASRARRAARRPVADRRSERRTALRDALVAAHLDAVLLTSLPNIRYITGFSGSSALAARHRARDDLHHRLPLRDAGARRGRRLRARGDRVAEPVDGALAAAAGAHAA